MTEEQLDALEDWITAIIHKVDRASDMHETIHCLRMRRAVEEVFGLRENK